jgi:oligopeptide transport system permease protein
MDKMNQDNYTLEMFKSLSEDEKSGEDIVRESTSYWKDAWKKFKKDPLALIGLVIIAVLIVFAIFGPMISPYTYDKQDYSVKNQWPSSEHWFGTDKMGRDIFTRILYGARISLLIGIASAVINLIIGVIYGGIAGYAGGKIDMVMMRIVDLLIGLPQLLYIILLMTFLGNNIGSILLALCITYWIGTARLVRSQVLSLKHSDYVLAAKTMGASDAFILFRHLIPNSMGMIIMTVTFLVPQAIFAEAFLSFLGIGIQIPVASWGTLANDAIPTLFTRPYQMIFPALSISITILAFNFIGDGLRDALDPRLRG